MDNSIFRSALNGFNRQDVMTYIERTQKETGEKTAELESQLEALRTSEAQLRTQLQERTQEKEDTAKELEELSARYQKAKEGWESGSAESDGLKSQLRDKDAAYELLMDEKSQLEAQVAELEDEIAQRRREKEQVAQLELDARDRCDALMATAQENALKIGEQAAERARETLSEAQAQAQAILQEAQEQITALAEKYQSLFDDFDTASAHITGELRRMDVAVSQLPLSCNHLRQSLSELVELSKER